MSWLKAYHFSLLDDTDYVTLEFEIKNYYIEFVNQALKQAIKANKGFSHKHLMGFMSSYIVFAMLKWLGAKKSHEYAGDMKKYLTTESNTVKKKCDRYKPHQNDDKRNDRVDKFRAAEQPSSILNQTVKLVRKIADNSIESCQNIVQFRYGHYKKPDNEYKFHDLIPYIREQTIKLKAYLIRYTCINKSMIDGFLVKQLTRQLAWCIGFFANLDHEPANNTLEWATGIIDTLGFNDKLLLLNEQHLAENT